MSPFLFAISFVHFSEEEAPRTWSTELLFHHAGIPLALFILIQDYRFVLLDAFIRFFANGLLAGLFWFRYRCELRRIELAGKICSSRWPAGVLRAYSGSSLSISEQDCIPGSEYRCRTVQPWMPRLESPAIESM
jgi:hypothetical protein